MALNRRELLTGLGAAAASAAIGDASPLHAAAGSAGFPRKADFAFEKGTTYISGAFTHPMPVAAANAYREFINRRGTVGATTPTASALRVDPKVAFAALINAKPSEVSYIPNTSAGENLVVECLGVGKVDGNVVTDALHFEGALVHLLELRKQGLDLRIVAPREGRIHLADFERVVDRKTRLVELRLLYEWNDALQALMPSCCISAGH